MICTAETFRHEKEASLLKPVRSSLLAYGAATQRHELANSLRGKQVQIPDLHVLFQSWPEATNTQLDALGIEVDQTLNGYAFEHLRPARGPSLTYQPLPTWKATQGAQGRRSCPVRSDVVAPCFAREALYCNHTFHLGELQYRGCSLDSD